MGSRIITNYSRTIANLRELQEEKLGFIFLESST
jgi:hypothetical protein